MLAQAARSLALCSLATLALAGSAHAELFSPRAVTTPVLDIIDVVVHNDEVLAIDPQRRGGIRRAALMVGEQVLWVGARGAVGLVVTDERMLGITAAWGAWQEAPFKIHESLPYSILLGDRVALVVTDLRAVGISTGGKKIFQSTIGTQERVIDGLVSDNVAVVVTDRRLLGVSGFVPGIVDTRVGIHEQIEYSSTLPSFVTIGTDDRVLVFRAGSASWDFERVSLR
jgi:hypothetical protein